MSKEAPGTDRRSPRPPVSAASAPVPGASRLPYPLLRRTVVPRTMIRPAVWNDPAAAVGYPHHHEYVRTFWVPIVGPGAVADLLRLATAATRGGCLPRPVGLTTLAREGLVREAGETVLVRTTIPPLSARHVRRLPPGLRRRHAARRWAGTTVRTGRSL